MLVDYIKYALLAVVLILVQALVFNHIHLFHYATPIIYMYLVMLFRRGFPRSGMLAVAFTIGLCIDIFSNTPGVAAASMTLLAFVQPYILQMFLSRDSAEDLQPSMRSLGIGKYVLYTFLCVFLYCLVFYAVETFSFFNWLEWLLCVGSSTLLTAIIILAMETVRNQ